MTIVPIHETSTPIEDEEGDITALETLRDVEVEDVAMTGFPVGLQDIPEHAEDAREDVVVQQEDSILEIYHHHLHSTINLHQRHHLRDCPFPLQLLLQFLASPR